MHLYVFASLTLPYFLSLLPLLFLLRLVPVFDGRYRLNFNNLRECPEYCRELEPGAAVAPIFTVHSYHPYGSQLSKHRVQKTDIIISFNIRALIYLKEPHPAFTHKQRINAREEAMGIIFPPVRGDLMDSDREATTTELDNDPLGEASMDNEDEVII